MALCLPEGVAEAELGQPAVHLVGVHEIPTDPKHQRNVAKVAARPGGPVVLQLTMAPSLETWMHLAGQKV